MGIGTSPTRWEAAAAIVRAVAEDLQLSKAAISEEHGQEVGKFLAAVFKEVYLTLMQAKSEK